MVAVTALVGTFLLAVVFYGVTAHIAARYVLGSTPLKLAFAVGVIPALLSVALVQFGPALSILFTATADFLGIRAIYRLKYKTAGLVALVHYTVSALLGITLYNLVALLSTAPT